MEIVLALLLLRMFFDSQDFMGLHHIRPPEPGNYCTVLHVRKS